MTAIPFPRNTERVLYETELLIDSLLKDLGIKDTAPDLHPADKLRRIEKELVEKGLI